MTETACFISGQPVILKEIKAENTAWGILSGHVEAPISCTTPWKNKVQNDICTSERQMSPPV